jgi:hypothetical protein
MQSQATNNQDFGFDFVVINGASEDGKKGSEVWNDFTEAHVIEADEGYLIPDFIQKSFEGQTILIVGAKCNSWADRAYPFAKKVKVVFYEDDIVPDDFLYDYEILPINGFYDWSRQVLEL